jgi:hypothetical protein
MADSAECWLNTTSKVSVPLTKNYSYLPYVKDALELRLPGVYSISCECGQVYIGKSRSSIQIRIKEHNTHK